jgi:hypothetical protein
MILDGHTHIRDGAADRAGFSQRLQEAGVDGGTLLSIPPPCFDMLGRSGSPIERLQDLFQWCASLGLQAHTSIEHARTLPRPGQ